ncbi:hypothetical protein [Paractinoplanes maris]|uniref:hypothetical protein n=1 Tax=Paractinoplanes maris TaxID=1734446 RepID=UPI002021CBCE|nr:hypothetical protein [Actinoplanes maris]
MRGGLDDALDKLARRDELRRRATGETPGTPAAVTELVEAVAAVVARHPELGVSVGVEGAGDPLLLHFYLAEGQVQVNAESAAALSPEPTGPRHADFDLDADDTGERPYSAAPYSPAPPEPGGDTRRLSQDDQDRFGPATFGHTSAPPASDQGYYADSDTAERRYGSFDTDAHRPTHDRADPRHPAHDSTDARHPAHDSTDARHPAHDSTDARHSTPDSGDPRYPAHDPGESSRDLGARLRDLGMATSGQPGPEYPPHPFAATPPPPVPPQSTPPRPAVAPQSTPPRPAVPTQEDSAGPTRRIRPEQHRPPAEPSAAERGVSVPEQRSMLTPLPQPIPLQVERPEETEMAARRLAALLRDDPSLLDQPRG